MLMAATPEERKKDMISIADELRQEGMEQGIAKGVEQGIVEGQRGMLVRQLQLRFGPLPPEVAERIERAPSADLERWADRVLFAATLAEVLSDPQ